VHTVDLHCKGVRIIFIGIRLTFGEPATSN
jgi:hypothetical protein